MKYVRNVTGVKCQWEGVRCTAWYKVRCTAYCQVVDSTQPHFSKSVLMGGRAAFFVLLNVFGSITLSWGGVCAVDPDTLHSPPPSSLACLIVLWRRQTIPVEDTWASEAGASWASSRMLRRLPLVPVLPIVLDKERTTLPGVGLIGKASGPNDLLSSLSPTTVDLLFVRVELVHRRKFAPVTRLGVCLPPRGEPSGCLGKGGHGEGN